MQTTLRAFTHNYLDIESQDYQLDQKKIRVIGNLKERFAILKPDKGQGVVLLSKNTYTNTVERIFKDKTKFKMLNPTLTYINKPENYTTHLPTHHNIQLPIHLIIKWESSWQIY